jgi:hypothetical protein
MDKIYPPKMEDSSIKKGSASGVLDKSSILDNNSVDVDQDVATKNNKTLVVICGCFNWL